MVKAVLIAATLVVWLSVGILSAVLVSRHTSASEPPYTGPYQIKPLVPTPGATYETTTGLSTGTTTEALVAFG